MSGTVTTCELPLFMNTDIGGIGVRASFYLQTIFLAALSSRSETLHETTAALSTLIATNIAMAVTALILGLKPEPEMSLQDGLVVLYLLAMSWVTVFFSLSSFHHFPAAGTALKFLSVLQSCLFFAFAMVIFITAEKFGNRPECNSIAVTVFFQTFPALKAAPIMAWIVVVAIIYMVITALDYFPSLSKLLKEWPSRSLNEGDQEQTSFLPYEMRSSNPFGTTLGEDRFATGGFVQRFKGDSPSYDLKISGEVVVKLILIFISWAMAVMNTELLIVWNDLKQDPSAQSPWQFGQVLPMFMLLQPFLNVVGAFSKHKLSPRQKLRRRD